MMRFRRPKPEPSWEQIVAAQERGADASRECLDIFRAILLDEAHADLKTFLFTSAVEGEGKTTMALHFAAMLATKGKRVLLVDAHWRRPALARVFGAADRPGLGDMLEAGADRQEPLFQDARLPQLSVLTTGTRNADLLDAAARERLSAFLQRQRTAFDFVLLDAAPTASGSEVHLLNSMVDGVLLVVACDQTQRAQVAAARADLEARGGKIVGAILNRVPDYLPAYYRTL